MTSYEYQQVNHIIDRIEEQREEDGRLALVGYIFFMVLGFTLGAMLF